MRGAPPDVATREKLAGVLARFHKGPTSGVFTDGACEVQPGRGVNPGPGGWGFVWVTAGRVEMERCGFARATTNNRMELTALIEALRALPEDAAVTVYSDSEICVKTINEWAAAWERRGWRRKSGAIKNLDLVKELWALARARPQLKVQWLRAHDGARWNEYADVLASSQVEHAR